MNDLRKKLEDIKQKFSKRIATLTKSRREALERLKRSSQVKPIDLFKRYTGGDK